MVVYLFLHFVNKVCRLLGLLFPLVGFRLLHECLRENSEGNLYVFPAKLSQVIDGNKVSVLGRIHSQKKYTLSVHRHMYI